uniref:CD59 glycoprotein n=1 Tax=Neogobius melanostomus TaxID=47308 RepID=A0A8C6X013_9GOBI
MKRSLLFCLIATFAFFDIGHCLQCYSCPNGSTEKCETKQECAGALNSCLKLKNDGVTYTSCVAYDACNFDALSLQYPLPQFKFSCCQSDLCNGPSFTERVKNFFG